MRATACGVLAGLWLSLCLAESCVAAGAETSTDGVSVGLPVPVEAPGPVRAPLHPAVSWSEALEQAKHPSDFTRILADGPPELWDAAAEGLLGERDEVSDLALPIVLQRLGALGPQARFRTSAALVRGSRDPRVLPLLARLAFEPGLHDDPRLQAMAARRFDDPGWRAALERYRRGEDPFPKEAKAPPAVEEPASRAGPKRGAGTTASLLLALLVSGGLGFALFLWGFRLLGLRRLVRSLPASRVRSLAVGQVALQGEAQPLDAGSLKHPDTGEVCLFHEGAGPGARFSVVDETGVVTVDPAGAVLLSADGVIVPGERVHLIGEARPAPGGRPGEVVVRAPTRHPSGFQRVAQLLVGSLMGGLFGRGSARMLFADPLRCFWIWDDLQAQPFTRPRETAWLVGAFVLAGGWVIVFFAAAAALLDR